MENNPELQLAWQFIENTGTHLFLTGKAGTGKTTFLRRLKEQSPKRMVILAPTGIAAINAGGVTIHSLSPQGLTAANLQSSAIGLHRKAFPYPGISAEPNLSHPTNRHVPY